MTQALEALPETTAEKQLEPATKSLPSSNRKSILLLSLFALILNGGAAIYTLPSFDIAMPDFSGMVAELLPHASVPIPDPIVTAALKDIQSTHQQYLAALQESGSTLQQNTVLLLRGATALELSQAGGVVSTERREEAFCPAFGAHHEGGYATERRDAGNDGVNLADARPQPRVRNGAQEIDIAASQTGRTGLGRRRAAELADARMGRGAETGQPNLLTAVGTHSSASSSSSSNSACSSSSIAKSMTSIAR